MNDSLWSRRSRRSITSTNNGPRQQRQVHNECTTSLNLDFVYTNSSRQTGHSTQRKAFCIWTKPWWKKNNKMVDNKLIIFRFFKYRWFQKNQTYALPHRSKFGLAVRESTILPECAHLRFEPCLTHHCLVRIWIRRFLPGRWATIVPKHEREGNDRKEVDIFWIFINRWFL